MPPMMCALSTGDLLIGCPSNGGRRARFAQYCQVALPRATSGSAHVVPKPWPNAAERAHPRPGFVPVTCRYRASYAP
eukprot:11661460-Alexandrium_andersonii.AAC.1